MPTLHDRFAAVVEANPDRLAVAAGGSQATFDELARQSGRLAAGLRALGVGSGDRVALIADHGVDAVAAFWGVFKLGAAIVQLNPKMGDDALRSVLAECAPKTVLVSDAHIKATAALLPDDTLLCSLTDPSLWPEAPSTGISSANTEDDLATIIYTSGSTGLPKGVCLTHRNLWTVVGAVIDDLKITPEDSYLMAVPLHYVHGVMQLLIHHLAGAAVHFAKDFAFPQQIVRALQATEVTGFSGVPFHFNSLIENSNFLEADLPALRWLTVTGGRLDAARIQTIRKAKPDIDFLVAYGQTECAPRATALSPKRIDRKPNSVGSPIRGVRVLILDDDGGERPQGEIGEVVVEGPNVMAGYWSQPEATQEVIDDRGRLHTGDLGYFDEEGDLFLVGRKSQMIKSAGERIIPKEIETVLAGAEGVLEAVVVGVPDAILGERVEAHVKLTQEVCNQTAKALIDRFRRCCLETMPLSRAPKRFHLWHEFPHRDNGKVDALRLKNGEGGKPFCEGGEHRPDERTAGVMRAAPTDEPAAVFDPGDVVSVKAADHRPLKGRLWSASSTGPLLVAAHGVMSHSLWFHQLAAALRDHGISLLAFDRRGAGLNREEPGEPKDDRALIDDLDAWMDFALTISGDLHLVGFCWGSNYALHYLGHRSEGIGSLILMAPGVAPSQKIEIRRSIDDLAPETQVPIPLPLEDFTRGPALEGFLRPDPLRLTHTSVRFIDIQNQIGRWSAVRLAKLRLPLLLILAERDDISDNGRIRTLFEKSSAAPKVLVEVPGRHGVVFDAPDRAADACRHWLGRMQSPTSQDAAARC